MTKRLLLTAAAIAYGGVFVLTGQQATTSAVFTAAQAAAGKTAYLSSCGKCHTVSLNGRKGEAGELPPVDSLPAHIQEMVLTYKGKIPPLTGVAFLSKWATTKDFSHRIEEAVGGFPPDNLTSESYLELTAYILQVNGARPGTQALTKDTAEEMRSVLPGLAVQTAKR